MQCGCPVCGALMGQARKGLQSKCRCPWCAAYCSACMGTQAGLERPLERGRDAAYWESLLRQRAEQDEQD